MIRRTLETKIKYKYSCYATIAHGWGINVHWCTLSIRSRSSLLYKPFLPAGFFNNNKLYFLYWVSVLYALLHGLLCTHNTAHSTPTSSYTDQNVAVLMAGRPVLWHRQNNMFRWITIFLFFKCVCIYPRMCIYIYICETRYIYKDCALKLPQLIYSKVCGMLVSIHKHDIGNGI